MTMRRSRWLDWTPDHSAREAFVSSGGPDPGGSQARETTSEAERVEDSRRDSSDSSFEAPPKLTKESAPVDQDVPPLCPTCAGTVWWRPDGAAGLHCTSCLPCPDRTHARWYTSPTSAADIVVDQLLSDPLVCLALNWAVHSAPMLADDVIAALARIERAGLTGTPTSDLFGQIEAAVDAVLRAEQGLDLILEDPEAGAEPMNTPRGAGRPWRLVIERNAPVCGPIRLNGGTVVEDVPRCVAATLADLELAVAAKNAGREHSMPFGCINELVERLAACGCKVRVEVVQ